MSTERERARPSVLDEVRFHVERFEYVPAEFVLRLSLRLPFEVTSTPRARLLVVCDSTRAAFPPLVTNCRPAPAAIGHGWLWRATFSGPGDFVCDSRAQFTADVMDGVVLRLPQPSISTAVEAAAQVTKRGSRYKALRRGGSLLIVTCQLVLVPAWLSGALADSPASRIARTYDSVAQQATEEPANTTPGATPAPPGEGQTTTTTESPPPPTETTTTPQPPPPAPETPAPTEAPPKETPGAEKPNQTGESPPVNVPTQTQPAPTSGAPASAAAPGAVASASTGATRALAPKVDPKAAAGHPRANAPAGSRGEHRATRAHRLVHAQQPKHASAAPVAAAPVADTSALSAAGVVEEVPPVLIELESGLTNFGELDPPAFLVPIYKAAGARYHVPWRVLAAINEVETNYGHNLSVSSAGAVGWMQFMPETWRLWAVDADHDGALNPYSPWDAIFTAARYLEANGAATDLPAAIFAYNHAGWYVTEVLARAHMLESSAAFAPLQKGYSLPLDARYLRTLGRTDDGVDIETAPDGALVYSITPGVVTAVASDPSGFGPNYPVVQATSGPDSGQFIYYGHVALALVHPGEKVAAGQPIAIIGHTGDAASLGHGHIEIGFSDASGDPLNHHGASAATPAGDVMRSLLVSLSAQFGVHNE